MNLSFNATGQPTLRVHTGWSEEEWKVKNVKECPHVYFLKIKIPELQVLGCNEAKYQTEALMSCQNMKLGGRCAIGYSADQ